ncbi:MAG: phosphoglycerate kinase, partial [Hyphomicrobiaceae bacterium]
LTRVLPGLRDLAGRGAKVIVLSHFGRPKGVPNPAMSLRVVAEKLSELAGVSIAFADDCVGDAAESMIAAMTNGSIVVLENLRFHAGEEADDPGFAAGLARLGDIYVNDAFSAAHRAHASTAGITNHLPSYAGPLMMEEINALRAALDQPQRPTVAVVGGAKVSSKISVLTNLIEKVDKLIIGGGMANTFLLAQGVSVGASLAEADQIDVAREILAKAKAGDCEIILPMDAVIAREFAANAPHQVVSVTQVPDEAMILDVGPDSVSAMTKVLAGCRTLLWNGPLGAFEISPFGAGTFKLAAVAADLTKQGQLASIAGGGDTVAALNMAGVTEDFTYVSTAGGAFLEWLEGRDLPGVVALTK